MIIRYDTEVGAYYLKFTDGPVARTVHISDDVMVDLDADEHVHGIELLSAPAALSPAERSELFRRFPQAEAALGELERLMPLSA
jgi:uncharacterized protein YuzE